MQRDIWTQNRQAHSKQEKPSLIANKADYNSRPKNMHIIAARGDN
jgi:hypothetical protein